MDDDRSARPGGTGAPEGTVDTEGPGDAAARAGAERAGPAPRGARRRTRPVAGRTGADRRARLAEARLYVCIDLSQGLERTLDLARSALRGGVDVLQVRDKRAEAAAELEALRALRPLADEHGALLAANDRADVAVLADADVLHLGQGDLSTQDARALLGSEILIGRSTHTPEQMRAADEDPDIDYFCTGPVWATPTKPGREAVGLDLPRAAASRHGERPRGGPGPHGGSESATGDTAPSTPFFAIGGIDLGRVPEVLASGAERIVVVRAITEAEDPEAAARALRGAVTAEG